MNILPKKRWHVRTKENVARVLRDEENARVEAEKEQERILKAESESRLALLRQQASSKYESAPASSHSKHIDLFSSFENKTHNKGASDEKVEEQKNWEIKVGYLKQLGQGSSELSSDKPWYQRKPEDAKKDMKRKQRYDPTELMDPLTEMNKRRKGVDYVTPSPKGTETVFVDIDFQDKVVEYSNERRKHGKIVSKDIMKTKKKDAKKKKKAKKKKRHRKHSSSSSASDGDTAQKSSSKSPSHKSIAQLREERLKREQAEHIRAERLVNPNNSRPDRMKDCDLVKPVMKQKYNSQFNPTYVRSNYSYSKKL